MDSHERDLAELYVYECRGKGYPRREPSFDGYLGIWPEQPFYYVFSGREALTGMQQWIKEQEGWSLRDTYRLDYDQWQQISGVEHRVGPFVIETPSSGRRGATTPADIRIHIDPGVVFGSGLHPTTRGCLSAIAGLVGNFPVRTAVDLGTGTGILAIACARMGVSKVIALDLNPLAVRSAKRNVRSNGQCEAIHMLAAEGLEVLRNPCDLLIMNLEWPCLKKVLRGPDWTNYRWVILSGFLRSQWTELEALLPRDYCVLQRQCLDDWVTAVISRKE